MVIAALLVGKQVGEGVTHLLLVREVFGSPRRDVLDATSERNASIRHRRAELHDERSSRWKSARNRLGWFVEFVHVTIA